MYLKVGPPEVCLVQVAPRQVTVLQVRARLQVLGLVQGGYCARLQVLGLVQGGFLEPCNQEPIVPPVTGYTVSSYQ